MGAHTRTLCRKSEISCVLREKVRDEHRDERARASFLCLLVLCVCLSFRAHAHLSFTSGLSYGDVPLVRLRCASGGIKPHCLVPLPRDFRLTPTCSLRLASFLLMRGAPGDLGRVQTNGLETPNLPLSATVPAEEHGGTAHVTARHVPLRTRAPYHSNGCLGATPAGAVDLWAVPAGDAPGAHTRVW
jgi:hypothetical protein